MSLTSVLPKLQSLSIKSDTIEIFVAALGDSEHIRMSPEGPTVPSLTCILSERYAAITPIGEKRDISYAITFCLKHQALEAWNIIMKRMVAPGVCTAGYICEALIPFIPTLRDIALKYNLLDRLAPTFQAIMLAWVDKVLRQKPAEDGSAELALLPSWQCDCKECSNVRAFLQTDPRAEASFERIGAVKRRHVESFLSEFASGACTWNTISKSPQGIHVSVTVFCFFSRS